MIAAIIIFGFCALLLTLSIIAFLFVTHIRLSRASLFSRYSELLASLEVAQDVAYSKVFRSMILVHHASGWKLDKSKMHEAQKEFIRLVLAYAGPKVIQELELIYGDFDSLVAMLVVRFQLRVGDDESAIVGRSREEAIEQI